MRDATADVFYYEGPRALAFLPSRFSQCRRCALRPTPISYDTPIKFDKPSYMKRNRIEIVFGRLKDWR